MNQMDSPVEESASATGPARWSKVEISLAGAIAVAIVVAVALVSSSGEEADPGIQSRDQATAPASPSAAAGRMTSAQFKAHVDGVATRAMEYIRQINDALTARDLGQMGAAADRLDVLVETDLDWQRENADQILGGCYDDAAASYSTWITQLAIATNYMQMHSQSGDPGLVSLITDSLQESLDHLRAYEATIPGADC